MNDKMKKKLLPMILVILVLIPSSNALSINNKNTITNYEEIEPSQESIILPSVILEDGAAECQIGQTYLLGWDPYDLFVIDPVQVAYEYQGRTWDDNCWEYHWKIMWWMAFLDGYNYADDPVYLFTMDYWPKADYGCWEGESFMYGGYNVTDFEPGDFDPWANLLALAIIEAFSLATGFPFSNVFTLVDALVDTEDTDPAYTWYAKNNVFDASGCFEYDFHVPADTTFGTSWWFEFGSGPVGSWTNGKGWRTRIKDWHSPPPPPDVVLTPDTRNWGAVKVGNYGGEYEFYLTNNDDFDVWVDDVYLEGNNDFYIKTGDEINYIGAGETREIKIGFAPTSSGAKTAELYVVLKNYQTLSSSCIGVGQKSRMLNTFLRSFLSNFLKDFYFF